MAFRGQRVMLSRNLVPAEKYEMLLGKVKQNEAEVIQCSNPRYNSKDDFHVLYSFNSERLAELQTQGCNVIGPECILQCARERRSLPSRKYTCCMSLEGMRILATGFDKKKKVHIEHLVSAMCGELYSSSSMDIDIVVAKDVLAPKYKWSAFTLRKPIVTLDWLVQSFQQHRRAPHEPYRLPAFAGLKVCATGILIDTRDKIADIITKNGGSFDADLTRECTHLIVKNTDSDKYKVAKRHWCNIKLVNEQWFWDSFTEKVCLEESAYAPMDGTINNPLASGINGLLKGPYNRLGEDVAHDSALQRLMVGSSGPAIISKQPSQNPVDCACETATVTGDAKSPMQQVDASDTTERNIVVRGETEDYLSGCRIFLAGFEPSEAKRLAGMVLDGGGTRHMEFQSRITHVILGKPSESDLKEIRQYALWGAIHVVLPAWIEECSRQRREVLVTEKYSVPHTLLAQENYGRPGTMWRSVYQEKSVEGSTSGNVSREPLDAVSDMRLGTNLVRPAYQDNPAQQASDEEVAKKQFEAQSCKITDGEVSKMHSELVSDERPFISPRKSNAQQMPDRLGTGALDSRNSIKQVVSQSAAVAESRDFRAETTGKLVQDLTRNVIPDHDSTASTLLPSKTVTAAPSSSAMQKKVFDGYVFEFTKSCQMDVRTEIVQWVVQGGGLMHGIAGETALQKLDFLIVPHGLKADPCDHSVAVVTPQWIKYCLEEGSILDTTSHVLFQPLPCEVPLPGFERFRFCVSQYADRERILLYNLCHVLGAKYQEKRMTKKATHLLCMVGDGEKYEAALRWGIEVVTAEWVHACVAHNTVMELYPYRPKRLTAADREAGLGIPTQFPVTSPSSGVGNDDIQQSGQQARQTQDQGETSQRERLDVKGKMANNKGSNSRGKLHPASVGLQTPAAPKTANVSLSSQMVGGNLDPWDELSASWPNQQDNKNQTLAKPQEIAVSSSRLAFKEPASVDLEVQSSAPADENTRVKTVKLVARESKYAAERNPLEIAKDEESGPDVAAAIEGLLAQSNKAQISDVTRSPDDRTLQSPASATLNRRRDEHPRPHTNFKRPKVQPNRPIEFDEEELPQSVTSGEAGCGRYQESQLESQVVAYDEDSSGKQLIMERVRTRSMSTTPPVRSGCDGTENEKMVWKVVRYGAYSAGSRIQLALLSLLVIVMQRKVSSSRPPGLVCCDNHMVECNFDQFTRQRNNSDFVSTINKNQANFMRQMSPHILCVSPCVH